MQFKTLTIVILFILFLYHLLLGLIEYRSARNPIPLNVMDVYDPDTYKKWRAYHAEKCRLSAFSAAAAFIMDNGLTLEEFLALYGVE